MGDSVCRAGTGAGRRSRPGGMTREASGVGVDMLFGSRAKTTMPTADDALPGRDRRLYVVPTTHAVLGTPLEGPWPDGTEVLYVAMGCFWGVERIFWQLPGVVTTAAGYMGGFTPNPTYEETCTGRTGHAETVLVAYDPAVTSPELLLKAFWENHDPTTANRQGNDIGTAYRSAIYWTTDAQEAAARDHAGGLPGRAHRRRPRRDHHRARLGRARPGRSTTPRTTTSSTCTRTPAATATTAPTA